jgi:hypothetical protein
LAAGLMAGAGEEGEILLLLPARADWKLPGGPGLRCVPWDSQDSAWAALVCRSCEGLVIDYDASAGAPGELLAFLRTAGSLAESWTRRGDRRLVLVTTELALRDEPGWGGLANLSRRQVLVRLADRADARFCFSGRSAGVLERRLRKPFELLPAGSALDWEEGSRRSDRESFGYGADEGCLIGVPGPSGELDEERIAVGLREVLRVFPSSRVLRSGAVVSSRLRALDLVLHPVVGGSEEDDGMVLACLQHGVPILGTAPSERAEVPFPGRPQGIGLFPSGELGGFLEWIERFEEAFRGGEMPRWREELEACYARRWSVGRAMERIAEIR